MMGEIERGGSIIVHFSLMPARPSARVFDVV